jgi:predicted HTH transcriptional regulator
MSPADLERLVRIGEGYHLEFKQRVSSPVRVAREAIALANTSGGTILVGIDDDGSIIGVKDVEEELFDVRKAFSEYCDPPIQLSFEIVPVSKNRDVIAIRVERSGTRPHALWNPEAQSRGEVLVRVNEHTITSSPERIQLMRHDSTDDGVKFEFGDKELFLLRYLETYDSIGVDDYAKMARISRAIASSTLVNLTLARVVELVPSEKGDRFVLNQRSNQASAG